MLFTLLVQVAVCFAGLPSLFHDHCVLALQRYILKLIVVVYVSDVDIMWWGVCTCFTKLHFDDDCGCVGAFILGYTLTQVVWVFCRSALCVLGGDCVTEYFAGAHFSSHSGCAGVVQRYALLVVVWVFCRGTCWLSVLVYVFAATPRGEDAGCVTTYFHRVQIHLHSHCYKGVWHGESEFLL